MGVYFLLANYYEYMGVYFLLEQTCPHVSPAIGSRGRTGTVTARSQTGSWPGKHLCNCYEQIWAHLFGS